jgi:hypothetical protein
LCHYCPRGYYGIPADRHAAQYDGPSANPNTFFNSDRRRDMFVWWLTGRKVQSCGLDNHITRYSNIIAKRNVTVSTE